MLGVRHRTTGYQGIYDRLHIVASLGFGVHKGHTRVEQIAYI